MNLEKNQKVVEKKIKATKREKSPERVIGAEERVRAVLAIWTERCKPSQVCQELGVQWVTISQWQDRAMEGMLQALEPRVSLIKGAALSPRLQQLMEKRQRSTEGLSQRLKQIQTTLKKTQEEPKME